MYSSSIPSQALNTPLDTSNDVHRQHSLLQRAELPLLKSGVPPGFTELRKVVEGQVSPPEYGNNNGQGQASSSSGQ